MAYEYESKETRVLKTIDSKRYPDTNKDFVKNIRRLNSSVDYISGYMRIMQKGIDDANKNFIEQIQSFINDLIVLFAGGEPTGIEIGDLKYVIQAIGSLFGFGTEPFPINLFNAARNFFTNWLSQIVQFTDLIFDSIEAWMLDLIAKVGDVPLIGDTVTRLANKIIDVTNKAQQGISDAAAAQARGDLGVSKADSASQLALDQLESGSNIIANPSFENAFFQQLGSSFSTDVFRTGTKALKMTGTGSSLTTPKYILLSDSDVTPRYVKVSGSDKFYAEVYVSGKSTNNQNTGGSNAIKMVFQPYNNLTALTPQELTLNATTALNNTWTPLSGYVTMPNNANRLKISIELTSAVISGQVFYFDDVSVREVTASANTNQSLYGTPQPATTILDGAVPGLDATKISGGQFPGTRIQDAAISSTKIVDGAVTTTKVLDGAVTGVKTATLDASKISTGSMGQARVTSLTTDLGKLNVQVKDGSNYVSGSDFDDTFLPWSLVSGFALDTVQKNSGTQSLKITAPATAGATIVYGNGTTVTYFEAKPGDQFYMELKVRKSADYVTDTSGPRFRAVRGNGTSAGSTIANIYVNSAAIATADQWSSLSTTFTMPSDTTAATSLYFAFTSTATVAGHTSGSVWVDDIIVRRINDSETIADNAVVSTKIGSGAVTNAKVATDAIATANIQASAVTGAKTASLDATKITSGQVPVAQVPSLPASQITSGTFGSAFLTDGAVSNIKLGTDISGDKIVAGTVLAARVGNLDAAKIVSGTFGSGFITDGAVTNAKVATDAIATTNIQASAVTGAKTASLDATKITTGTMAQAQVTNLGTDLSARVDYTAYQAFLSGGSSNLATNPSFEDTTQYLWSAAANTNATYVRSGSRSLSLTASGAYKYIGVCTSKTSDIYVQGGPNTKYYYEFYVKGDAANTTTGTAIAVNFGIWYYDKAKVYLGLSLGSGLTYDQIGTTDWVKASGYITVSNNANIAFHRPIIHLPSSATAGIFYFDDVLVEDVTEIAATNTALFNQNTAGTTILDSSVPFLDASKINAGTFGSARITDGAIITAKIAADAVDTTKIAPNAVTSAELGAAAVTTAKIASGAVTSTELGAASVTNAKVATDAIATANIQASAVTGAKTATLDATKITAGTLPTAQVPTLDRTKIYGTDFTNLLQDGGFENSVGVYSGTYTIATPTGTAPDIVPVGGTKVLQLASTGAVVDVNLAPYGIPVNPGEIYYIEYQIRKTTTGTTGTVGVGTSIALNGTSWVGYPAVHTTMAALTQNTWAKQSGFVTVPAGANYMVVRATIRSDVAVGQTLQYDNVVVRRAASTDVIPTDAITTAQIAANAVTGTEIAADAVGTTQIAANAVTGTEIAADAVGTSQLAPLAVTSTELGAGAVTTAKIGTGAVTSNELGALSVTNAKVATDAIDTANIKNSAVTGGKTANLDATKISAGSLAQSYITDLSRDFSRVSAFMNSGANLVADPGFENSALDSLRVANAFLVNASGWSHDSTATFKRTGSRSVKYVATGTTVYPSLSLPPYIDSGYIPVRPGQVFYVAQWVYAASANTGTGLVGMYLHCNNSSTAANTYPGIEANYNGTSVAKGTYVKMEAYIAIPAGYDRMRPYFFSVRPGTNLNDAFYCDDLELYDVTDAYYAQTTAQETIDNVANAFYGTEANSGVSQSDALTAMQKAYETLGDHTRQIQELQSAKTNASVKGASYSVNFNSFATMADAGFTVTYTGANTTSTIGISSGLAQWQNIVSGDRDAKVIYNSSTNTDYQLLQGTMSSPPENNGGGTSPRFSAIGRVSSDGNSYVFARAYCDGFLSFKGEIGYVLNGVETIWASAIPLTWSLDMTFKVGNGTNKRQYQVYSGKTLVKEWDETFANGVSGTANESRSLLNGDWLVSRGAATAGTFTLTYDGSTTAAIAYNATAATIKTALGALGKGTFFVNATTNGWYVDTPDDAKTFTGTGTLTGGTLTVAQQTARKWGSIAQLRNSKGSGKIGGCSVSDNQTPTVNGSVARMARKSTTNVTYTGGSSETVVPNSFFDDIPYESLDIDANTSDGTFTVKEAKPYFITARVLTGNVAAWGQLILQVYNGSSWSNAQYGQTLYTNDGDAALNGSWIQYLNVNEKVRLAYVRAGITTTSLTGESTGKKTYFAITGAG